MYQLYRIHLNERGEGVGQSRHEKYAQFEEYFLI